MVEQDLNRFRFNVRFANQPYFVSSFPNYVLQAEVPRDCKTPKSLTKFSGDKDESIAKHVARYTIELGELASNELLKMRFFPSSLTKNSFTWFSNLRLHGLSSKLVFMINFLGAR